VGRTYAPRATTASSDPSDYTAAYGRMTQPSRLNCDKRTSRECQSNKQNFTHRDFLGFSLFSSSHGVGSHRLRPTYTSAVVLLNFGGDVPAEFASPTCLVGATPSFPPPPTAAASPHALDSSLILLV